MNLHYIPQRAFQWSTHSDRDSTQRKLHDLQRESKCTQFNKAHRRVGLDAANLEIYQAKMAAEHQWPEARQEKKKKE